MEPVSAVTLGLLGLGAALGLALRKRSRDDITRRAFAKPIAKIKDVRNGSVVVVAGTVSAKDSIPSYLSATPCLAYEYVEVYEEESVWREHLRRKESLEFSLRDESGEALVRGAGAELLLNKHKRVPADESWERREGLVESGDEVAVVGHANWEPDPRPESAGIGYRQRPTVLVIRGTRRTKIRLTNSPAILARAPTPSSSADD